MTFVISLSSKQTEAKGSTVSLYKHIGAENILKAKGMMQVLVNTLQWTKDGCSIKQLHRWRSLDDGDLYDNSQNRDIIFE